MKKSHIAILLIFLLVIPATLIFGLRLSGRAYYFTSTLVIIEIIIPFLLAFESRKPQARELVVIAVLSALAVAARVVIPIPNFKAIFAIIMLSGMAFGPEVGFLVGAVSAFASNFFYGQGAYPLADVRLRSRWNAGGISVCQGQITAKALDHGNLWIFELCSFCWSAVGYLYGVSDSTHYQCSDSLAALCVGFPGEHQPGRLFCTDHVAVWSGTSGETGPCETAIWHGGG